MAISSVGLIPWPPYGLHNSSGSIGFSGNFYLDNGTAPKIAYVFQCPKAGSLEYAEFYIGSSTVGANQIKASFQGVTASGLPDGVVGEYLVYTASTGWNSRQLTSTGAGGGGLRSVAQGELVALVFEFNATQSGFYEPHCLNTDGNAQLGMIPWCCRYTGGSWTKATFSAWPNFAIKYSDGSFGMIPGARPVTSTASTAYNSGSAPDERALRFNLPCSVRVAGLWAIGTFGNACDFVLYDSDGTTVLATTSYDPDYVQTAWGFGRLQWRFSSSVTLLASTTYRLAVKPTSGSNVSLFALTVNSNALLGAYEAGIEFYLSTRTNAGAWSDTNTILPELGLLIDGVDVSAPGGGGATSYAFIG